MFGELMTQFREQAAELNAVRRERERSETQPERAAGGQSYSEDDLNDLAIESPAEAMRVVMRQELEGAIQPFIEDRKASTRLMARQQMEQQFDDWGRIEPYVDYLLRSTGQEESAQVLAALYYSAKGMLSSGAFDGVPGLAPPPTQPKTGGEQHVNNQTAPPQHRPSRAPLASSGGQNQEVELTENERRLAREFGMTPEEYKQMQDLDAGQVASTEIGLESA